MDNKILHDEYDIVLKLYTNHNEIIKKELIKVINLIIDTIEVTNKDLNYLIYLFFSETLTEYGQIGKQEITTKPELTELINSLNIRELFTVINNFRKKIDCFMFELLINYKKNPKEFIENYPYLDISYIEYIINFIENMLDVDILDLDLCYNEAFNEIPCEPPVKPFYRSIQDDKTSYMDETGKPINNSVPSSTICSLWLPYAYGNNNQLLLKITTPNKLYNIVTNSMKKKQTIDEKCVEGMMKKYPFVEPLSPYEINFLKLKQSDTNKFLFAICNSEPNDANFTTQLRKKYNKLMVSYTSGHTVIMLMLCKYFKGINLGLITLGCIIWLVPYNHSITEIFLAAKQLDIFKNFTLKKDILTSVNEMLRLSGVSSQISGGANFKKTRKRHSIKKHFYYKRLKNMNSIKTKTSKKKK